MSPAIVCGGQAFRVRKMQDRVTAGLMRNNLPLGLAYWKNAAAKRELLVPSPLPSEKIGILACFTGNRGQAGEGSQQAYPSLHALKIHVSTGFYWNVFSSGRE